jgi:hypothetical protein
MAYCLASVSIPFAPPETISVTPSGMYFSKSLSIRIDEEMLDKLHFVADYEGRSANSQILILIRDLIEDYEKKHGEIKTGKR